MVKNTSKKRWTSAREYFQQREKDPVYLARKEGWERKAQEARVAYQEAASGVLADLATAGYQVDFIGDLIEQFARTKIPYEAAIPILMSWLPRVSYIRLQEDIVRTLSVPWAKPLAARLMVDEFVKVQGDSGPPHGLRWAIGNALWVVADDSVFDDLVTIATNKKYGTGRQMVVMALGNMKKRDPTETLIGLLDDEDVAGHAVIALGKLKTVCARSRIEPLLRHPRAWIRTEARKALKRIDKAAENS